LQRSVRWARYPFFERDFPTGAYGEGWVPFTYDQTHVANATLSYAFARGWSAGVTLHFNSGRPEAGELTSVTHVPSADRFGNPIWTRVDAAHVDRLPPFF